MKQIITDWRTEYMNEIFSQITEILGTLRSHSAPYHHDTLGTIERSHRVFNEYLWAYTQSSANWDEHLKYFTYCYNNTPHSSYHGKYTPFELVFGKKREKPHVLNSNRIDPIYNIDDYSLDLKYKLQQANKMASELIEHSKSKAKNVFDKQIRQLNIK